MSWSAYTCSRCCAIQRGHGTNVSFRAIINIRPGLRMSDKKITGEGQLPAKYNLSAAVRDIGTTIGKLLGR